MGDTGIIGRTHHERDDVFHMTVRTFVKQLVSYEPKNPGLVAQLEAIRLATPEATIVQPYVGDAIFDFIVGGRLTRCLEVGMATGSTASYMLNAVAELGGGEVISIDRAQTTQYASLGLRTVQSTGFARWHRLIESDSVGALHDLWRSNARVDFVFMDGWKTFDHLATELYFVVRILTRGGFVMFDDLHMPSVRRAVRMLQGHYAMTAVDALPQRARLELAAHAVRHLVARPFDLRGARAVLRGPVATLRKERETDDLPVTKDWNFYSTF